MNYQKLSELRKGQKARVVGNNTVDKQFRQRLLDMGITRGVEVMIAKTAPFGDPVDIALRGYELCLRKKDLAAIDIEVIV